MIIISYLFESWTSVGKKLAQFVSQRYFHRTGSSMSAFKMVYFQTWCRQWSLALEFDGYNRITKQSPTQLSGLTLGEVDVKK